MNNAYILFDDEPVTTDSEGGHTSGSTIDYVGCEFVGWQLKCYHYDENGNKLGEDYIKYYDDLGGVNAANTPSYTETPAQLDGTIATSFDIINKMYALPMSFNGVDFNVWLLIVYVLLLIGVAKLFAWLGHGG